MSVFQGDFLGFQLGNEHSYGLNITRVSTNDRYMDNLVPDFTDQVAQVPGGDGTYYWDTYYTQRTITVDFAFDDLRDEDLRALRQMFGYRGLKKLIFDEFPYKYYMVKCQSAPQLKYICFDHLEFRIYKGEGTVNFIAYYPFARGVVSPKVPYSLVGTAINNVGDLPADLELIYDLGSIDSGVEINLLQNNTSIGYMKLESIIPISGDTYISINSRTQLIEGLDATKEKTGTLYNKYLTTGDFIHPPIGNTLLTSTKAYEFGTYTPIFY